jgi:hypothetical protein
MRQAFGIHLINFSNYHVFTDYYYHLLPTISSILFYSLNPLNNSVECYCHHFRGKKTEALRHHTATKW